MSADTSADALAIISSSINQAYLRNISSISLSHLNYLSINIYGSSEAISVISQVFYRQRHIIVITQPSKCLLSVDLITFVTLLLFNDTEIFTAYAGC